MTLFKVEKAWQSALELAIPGPQSYFYYVCFPLVSDATSLQGQMSGFLNPEYVQTITYIFSVKLDYI